MLQQFENPANPAIHCATTGPEIWDDTDGKVDFLSPAWAPAARSPACSHQERKPEFKAIAVEPTDSPVLSGGKPGPHKIQGIGAGFVPSILDPSSSTKSSRYQRRVVAMARRRRGKKDCCRHLVGRGRGRGDESRGPARECGQADRRHPAQLRRALLPASSSMPCARKHWRCQRNRLRCKNRGSPCLIAFAKT